MFENSENNGNAFTNRPGSLYCSPCFFITTLQINLLPAFLAFLIFGVYVKINVLCQHFAVYVPCGPILLKRWSGSIDATNTDINKWHITHYNGYSIILVKSITLDRTFFPSLLRPSGLFKPHLSISAEI